MNWFISICMPKTVGSVLHGLERLVTELEEVQAREIQRGEVIDTHIDSLRVEKACVTAEAGRAGRAIKNIKSIIN